MRTIDRAGSREVDALFAPYGGGGEAPLEFQDLTHLSRIIVEYLHTVRPAVLIAADRSCRLPAKWVYQAWQHRFPGDPFPTIGEDMYHVRVTSRSASEHNVTAAIHSALAAAGIPRNWSQSEAAQRGDTPPRAALLDDWVTEGGTAERFVAACREWGLPPESIFYLTLSGRRLPYVTHAVADPHRDPRASQWQDSSELADVSYPTRDGVTPVSVRGYWAGAVREGIPHTLADYYRRFSAALAAGTVVACNCLHLGSDQQPDISITE